jgi:hypothetical protein
VEISDSLKRQKLSIQLFGRFNFWTGLLIGCTFAVLLFLFLLYSHEIAQNAISLSSEIIVLTPNEQFALRWFLAAISITAGFGIAAWCWFHNPFRFNHRYSFNQFVRTHLFIGTLILLISVLRSGDILVYLFYGLEGYDNHFNFYEQVPELLVLLPTFFFLNVWTPIRIKYRAGNWFWYSILIYVVGSLLLSMSCDVDQSNRIAKWKRANAPYQQIVDTELSKARAQGIELDSSLIEILNFNTKERVVSMAKQLKKDFQSPNSIPPDKLVAELILIKKSFVRVLPSTDRENERACWPFALPSDVYHQLTLTNDPLKKQYLHQILAEQCSIFMEYIDPPWIDSQFSGLEMKYRNREAMNWRYRKIESEIDSIYRVVNKK